MKLTKVIEYVCDDGRTLRFCPADGVPGFSHRVIIDGKPVDWLGTQANTCAKVARYYLAKHAPGGAK